MRYLFIAFLALCSLTVSPSRAQGTDGTCDTEFDEREDPGRYRGQCLNGIPHGHGTAEYNNGDTYTGDFEDGMRNGRGRYVAKAGWSYQGEWLNKVIHGKGVFIFANGDKYEGGFSNELQSGRGTLTTADGDSYVGDWVEGEMHGQGTLQHGGVRSVGFFKNGRFWKGWTYKSDGVACEVRAHEVVRKSCTLWKWK